MNEHKGKLATLKLWLKNGTITTKQYIDAKFKLEEKYGGLDIAEVKRVLGNGATTEDKSGV